MKKIVILLLMIFTFSFLNACALQTTTVTEAEVPTIANITISNRTLKWTSLDTINFKFNILNNNKVAVNVDFLITLTPSEASRFKVVTSSYTLDPGETQLVSHYETVGAYESCNVTVSVNNLSAVGGESIQTTQRILTTTAQQAFNARDFIASLDIIGDGAGTWNNTASFSVNLQWSFIGQSKYDISNSITTNITVMGYVDYEYVYFDSDDNYQEDTSRQYFTGVLYKSQNYQNLIFVTASIHETYGNEIAALANANMYLTSVTGTLVRK